MSEVRTVFDPFEGRSVEVSNRLVDRLRGKYASGPHLPNGNPEFGWRQFQAPPIQHEAAAEIERLQSRIEELERALKPFAELGGAWASIPTALPLFIRDEYETIIQGGLTVRAFIDARSALEASNQGGKP